MPVFQGFSRGFSAIRGWILVQREVDSEATGGRDFGGDGSATGRDCGADDGEAEAVPSGFAAAGAIRTVERFKKARQVFGGDAWSIIRDGEDDFACGASGAESDVRARTGMGSGIADQVSQCAGEEPWVGQKAGIRRDLERKGARGIVAGEKITDPGDQFDGLAMGGRVSGAGEFKEFVDEVGEFRSVAFDAIEARVLAGMDLVFEDSKSGSESGEWRAKFVSGIAEEALLDGDEVVEAAGHRLDGGSEQAEFVAAAEG